MSLHFCMTLLHHKTMSEHNHVLLTGQIPVDPVTTWNGNLPPSFNDYASSKIKKFKVKQVPVMYSVAMLYNGDLHSVMVDQNQIWLTVNTVRAETSYASIDTASLSPGDFVVGHHNKHLEIVSIQIIEGKFNVLDFTVENDNEWVCEGITGAFWKL